MVALYPTLFDFGKKSKCFLIIFSGGSGAMFFPAYFGAIANPAQTIPYFPRFALAFCTRFG
jgi:hypothetical protein